MNNYEMELLAARISCALNGLDRKVTCANDATMLRVINVIDALIDRGEAGSLEPDIGEPRGHYIAPRGSKRPRDWGTLRIVSA